MRSISPKELHEELGRNRQLFLLDVREDWEHDAFNIGGVLIPLGEVLTEAGRIPNDKPVVVVCRKGVRSQIAIQRLEEKFGFTNLTNLEGGLEAYRRYLSEKHPD